MELSMFTPEKKKTVFSLHYSPSKFKYNQTQEQLESQTTPLNKPNFLYFTHRQRQKINFFDNQSIINNQQTPCQKEIDYKISTSFFKTFKLKSKHFDFQQRSFHEDNSLCASKQKFKKLQIKTRSTLRKKAYQYKKEQPCVGMYNAKPENFMKRIAKNELFRKGKSCHNITSKNENQQKISIKNSESHSRQIQNSKQKGMDKENMKRINSLNLLRENKKQSDRNNFNSSFFTSRTKIKCFDMSKQTPREPFKIISNKIEEIDFDNNYIERNHKKQIYIPVPMNGQELSWFYEKQKKKYGIQSSCGIFKHIKLEDFIKLHRNEVVSQDQNSD